MKINIINKVILPVLVICLNCFANDSLNVSIEKDYPMYNKNFGLEINPITPILGIDDAVIIFAGIQIFSLDRRAEISFPIQYQFNENNFYSNFGLHYRRFLMRKQNGLFLSAFFQTVYFDLQEYDPGPLFPKFSDLRLGSGIGIGYRIYTSKRFYWGASINYGWNFYYKEPADDQILIFAWSDFNRQILDIEFFKFGIAF